ncbi:MAG TPA: peptidase T [Gaiellaceae bacterium]|nr:peptidase T [Gaiellaceae bacterium]
MKDALLERFVRYARVGTQAVPDSPTFPSSPGQLELQRLLAEDLRAAGLQEVVLDDDGYLYATVPATVEDAPTIGWIAHVDTAPDAPGDGVEPIVHRAYDGGRIELPRGGTVLDPEAMPQLRDVVGHDLVTSSGDTLLGADDKAGVAAIVTAAAELVATGAPRPRVRVCFTPDEEIGLGASRFDVEGFGAVCAYTVDGSEPPYLSDETFHAVELRLVVRGHDVHPGYATGVLVHAGRLAAKVVAALPDDVTPERTGGREGFVHVTQAELTAARAEVRMIVRAFDEDEVAALVAMVRRIAADHVPAERLEVEERFQYPNMRRFVDAFPEVTAAAEAAYRAAGLEPVREPIRGGTDGSGLSARGLPTPNLFDGGREFHSVREWASLDDMALAARVLVELAAVWTQEPFRSAVAEG